MNHYKDVIPLNNADIFLRQDNDIKWRLEPLEKSLFKKYIYFF